MYKTKTSSGLENILERARGIISAVIPLVKNPQDDVKYLEDLVAKNPRFRDYRGSIQLREYLSDVLREHKTMLYVNKLAETLDRAGVFFAGEEIVEIPLKTILYLAQTFKLATDKRLNIPFSRLLGMGAKYSLYELFSLIPIAGELADITNVYYKEYMKAIASGIKYEDFIKSPAYRRPVIDIK